VAAAVEAIQRMSGSAAAQTVAVPGAEDDPPTSAPLRRFAAPGARFCVWCGISNEPVAGAAAPSRSNSAQHHFHHHYHHFVPGPGAASGAPLADSDPSASSVHRGRAPGAPGSTGGRAEAAARQVVQDWAQACNTRHIDDLLELYAADATLIRSSLPPVRSLPAIREFLISLLEAGLAMWRWNRSASK